MKGGKFYYILFSYFSCRVETHCISHYLHAAASQALETYLSSSLIWLAKKETILLQTLTVDGQQEYMIIQDSNMIHLCSN